jgi:hypothetical protein
MRFATPRLLAVLCLLLGSAGQIAQGKDSVLSAIPDDALSFAVVHNLSGTSRDVGELAKILQAPDPDLLSMAKGKIGIQKGIDEQGDLALVLASVDPAPIHVILAPVENFADFFAALNVKEPESGVVEVQLAGKPSLVGRKGNFAVMARVADKDALEKYIASTTSLAADKALAEWVDANRLSVVVTPRGIKQLLPKLTVWVRMLQEQIRSAGGENGAATAGALDMYVDLFEASQKEVEQFGVGVRIDSAQTVDIVKRVQFAADGNWAKWAATAKPSAEDPLGGLEAKPFVFAGGGSVPEGAMKALMQMSVKMMQNQPAYKLTPEQAQKYADLSVEMMSGLKSMRILMGVPEPGAGVYGNTTAVMTVDDSKRYFDAYEKSLAEMHTLAENINSPGLPVVTSRRVKIDEIDALEASVSLPNVQAVAPAGGPDPQQIMKLFVGPEGVLKYYLATADEHTVVMSYISPDRLKEAIEFYKSKKPGLSADAALPKVAEKLPAGSQFIGYVSVSGMAKMAKQLMAAVPGAPPAAIPDFPVSQPIGFAVKLTPGGVEGHLVVTGDTLRMIGDTVAKTRAEAGERRVQQQ